MTAHDIIVIGASAGGIEALQKLIGSLPSNFTATLFVVIHFPPTGKSSLPTILNRRGPLPAAFATDGEGIVPGRIYIAPADYHLLLEKDRVRIYHGPRENHTRPAIDPLFRSAAQVYGARVIGILLSGMLNDGTAGLIAIKQQGGIAIVQDPAEALFADMPHSAIKHANVDHILPVAGVARMLTTLVSETPPQDAQTSSTKMADVNDTEEIAMEAANNDMPANENKYRDSKSGSESAIELPFDTDLDHIPNRQHENALIDCDSAAQIQGIHDEMPSIYSCPDCGGVLWQINEKGFLRFRCHVGHSHSAESLLAQQSEVLETSMWYAVRTLVDKAKLSWQMAQRAKEHGYSTTYARFVEQARTAERHARVLRDMIESTDSISQSTKSSLEHK